VVYRRRELGLVLLLAVSLGTGLAVREFRAGFANLADRLEELDREEPTAPVSSIRAVSPHSTKPFRTEPPQAHRLDLNRATVEELQALPGIGPTLAGQIVRARERRGRFESPEDLRNVPGIGPKKLEGIRDLITASRAGNEGREAVGRAGDDEGREAVGRAGAGAGAGDETRGAEGWE
jgi:competence ComEA-like helix-hairpin-helix protein